MKEVSIKVYQCDFCKCKHESAEWMALHEEVCAMNPINQPCSTCMHQILNYGCAKHVNMEIISGNIKCFYYEEGIPKDMFNIMMLDGNLDPRDI